MIADLKEDTAKIATYIKAEKKRGDLLDSLITILNDQTNVAKYGNGVYYFGRLGPRLQYVPVNMRTVEQLKNSGSFRLISDMTVSNAMMSYYEKVPEIRQIEALYAEEFAEYKKIAENVFEPAIFKKLEKPNSEIIRASDNPALQKNASAYIKALAINAVYMNGSRRGLLARDEDLLKNAKELLVALQDEYHLKDE